MLQPTTYYNCALSHCNTYLNSQSPSALWKLKPILKQWNQFPAKGWWLKQVCCCMLYDQLYTSNTAIHTFSKWKKYSYYEMQHWLCESESNRGLAIITMIQHQLGMLYLKHSIYWAILYSAILEALWIACWSWKIMKDQGRSNIHC